MAVPHDDGGNSSMQGYMEADVHGMWTHTRSDSSALMALIGKCYAQIHGYVSVIVCVTSILVNLATVVVLTRRHMSSPSNIMLTGIAVTETLKMVAYAVYAYEFNLVTQIDSDVLYPLGWIYYLLVHASLSLVLYAIVTWLTVLLAVFRYIVVCVQHGQQKVTQRVARLAVMCVYVFCTAVYIPSYVSLYAVPSTIEVQERRVLPSVMQSALEDKDNESEPLFVTVNITLHGYTYGVHDSLHSAIKIIHGPVLKLLASVIITVPTTLLIVKMQQAAKKRIILKGSSRRKVADPRPRRATLRSRINNAATAISALPRRISSVRQSSQSAAKSDCALVVVTPCEPLASVLHSNSNGETHLSDTSAPPSRSIFAPEISDVLGTERPRSKRCRHASQKGSQENHRRTTVLLLAVVMCFVVVEFPHGVMLLVGQLSEDFYHNVYAQLGDLLDLVALLSSSLNFVLYCTMSRQFRTTFADTFVAPVLRLFPSIRGQHLERSDATRIVYAHKRSNTKKSVPACPDYVVVQPPTLLLDDERGESDKHKLVRLADERPALLSTNACLGIPSHVSEISVSVFSGASSTSRTSQFSAVSHLSAFSAASQRSDGSRNSHLSAQSNSTTTTTTTTTTSTTADSVQFV